MTSDHDTSATALQRIHIHSPITALAFSPTPGGGGASPATLLLSGQDTHLKIYSTTTDNTSLLASLQIFPAQPIQGLTTCPTTHAVLLWGGPWLAILPAARVARALLHLPPPTADDDNEITILRAPDWIYHAAFLTPTTVVAVTAHNEVLPLRWRQLQWTWGAVLAPPSSRPILYAARLECVGGGQVLVAAGTVFGEIVVWRCRIDEGEVEVLCVLTGHEGSIFGVDISPELCVDGERVVRLLASCSDDRTIRVWDISECVSLPWGRAGRKGETRRFVEARETGFGEDGVAGLEVQDGRVAAEPVAVAMGHVSRIWNVRFARSSLADGNISEMKLYSFGEDATAQKWRLDLERRESSPDSAMEPSPAAHGLAASLTHEGIIHRHSGKHIWSSAILEPTTPDGNTLVATGGGDGKINIVEEIPPDKDTRSVTLDVSGAEIVRRFPDADADTQSVDALAQGTKQRKNAKPEDEPFLVYALVPGGPTLATTSSGRLFRGVLDGAEMSWSEVPMSQEIRHDLRQSHILRSTDVGTVGVALLGSTSGNVYVYSDGAVSHVCKVAGKISDIFTFGLSDLVALGLWDHGEWTRVPIIVSTVGSSVVTLFVLASTASGFTVLEEHAIELDAGFVPKAVGCCSGYLIFGSRIGALLVYKPTYKEEGSKVIERIARVERPLTRDAVTCIIPLPPRAGVTAPYFLTTSRDGRYRIYEITPPTPASSSSSPSIIAITLRHEAIPPLGPNLESALFTPGNPIQLTLTGFRSKSFVAWNETRSLELAAVECGGAFRSFTHRVVATSNAEASLSFVWTHAGRTRVYAQKALAQRVVRPGGHGREIKAVAACGGLVATGAEDTTVRIWSYEPVNTTGATNTAEQPARTSGLRPLAVIEKHTTGIQCLRWAGPTYLLSSSGNEELCIWRITRLAKSDYDGLAVMCEATYPDRTRDGDLRIMGFDVQVMPPPQKLRAVDDYAEEEVLCISLVLSNSTLRTYRYSRSAGFTLLGRGRYTGACLLQIRHLHVAHDDEGGWQVHVLTAATDGHVALWKLCAAATSITAEKEAAAYELVEVVALHQSSIKSLDLRPLSTDPPAQPAPSYVVVTGGDDNALGCVALLWSAATRCYAVSSRARANGAHAAAVTGLCITGVDEQARGGRVVDVCTASTDQRVKRWRIGVGGEGGKVKGVKLVGDKYSAVADAGDLEVLEGGRDAVVVGVGMEVWRL